jgi:hypothetical protein
MGSRRRLHMPHSCLDPKAMRYVAVAAAFASVPLRSSAIGGLQQQRVGPPFVAEGHPF